MKNETMMEADTKLFVPPGVPVKEISFSPNGTITFADKRPYTPLPPLVEVHLTADKKHIKVSTVFFIDAAETVSPNSFSINQEFCISDSGESRLQFFISYDVKETKAVKFQGYQVSFKAVDKNLPDGVKFEDIKTIQTFLWDTDPVSSRGTVTNVQS